MQYLFDSQSEVPALEVIELPGAAMLHCFHALLVAYQGEGLALEVAQ